MSFVHLNLHSEYSIQDGLVRIPELIKAVVAENMPAVAVTDSMNIYAAVKFYQAAIAAGVKPIFGSEIYLHNPSDVSKPVSLVLLCQNKMGYRNLSHILSNAYRLGVFDTIPHIAMNELNGYTEGLIALSGAQRGFLAPLLHADKQSELQQALDGWRALFPERFYIEVQRTGRPAEEEYLQAAVHCAAKYSVPVVATNAVQFLTAEDYDAHEARVCIQSGYVLADPKREKLFQPQQFLRTPPQMQALFADLPEAITNSIEIAKRCNVMLDLGVVSLPDFTTPDNISIEDYLEQSAQRGLQERLCADKITSVYHERLVHELAVINRMGYAGYFLIVADFIQWAKKETIPVGPGRGSGAGSLVAYALRITDLDPLEYDLLFERFLNPERVSMPDFDIDFCMEGRDRVIEYVADKYGRDSVAQIITFGTMAARAVVRDVGRVLNHPYGYVDKLAKLIPFELGITLKKALEQEDELKQAYKEEEEVKAIIDLAQKLEGLARNAGKHAGGVVIAPSKLTDFTALYCESKGKNIVTQFDKDDVEAVGLVKFDFLGLRTLTIIKWALHTINQRRVAGDAIDINQISLDDTLTYELLKRCQTTAVFQLESRGMKDLIKRLEPDCFEDIIALVALYRPGPLQSGMVDDFIERKHGRAKVSYLHPALETILKPTYGVILYQEQVMQIAQELAGYTLGAADLLRRAMGKKKPEAMAKQRAVFVEGATERDVDSDVATTIFDLMEKFAGYGFNKSHSAAYALISYQTAWLKAHYTAAFMAAVLSADMDNTDKIVLLLEECKALGLTVLPPCINRSVYAFAVQDEKTIVYGLGAIKGVGESVINSIVTERSEEPFQDLLQFCQRISAYKISRRVFEALIRSGACDHLGEHRGAMLVNLDRALGLAQQQSASLEAGQDDMFAMHEQSVTQVVEHVIATDIKPQSDFERLQGEKETLGLFLSGHVLDAYRDELKKITHGNIGELDQQKAQTLTIAGLVSGLRKTMSKRGLIAFVTLEDGSGRIDVTVFSEQYQEYKDLLIKDRLLIVTGEVSIDNFNGNLRMVADTFLTLDAARQQYARALMIRIDSKQYNENFGQSIQACLSQHRGGECPVFFDYHSEVATTQIQCSDEWKVLPNQLLLDDLTGLCGKHSVCLRYLN